MDEPGIVQTLEWKKKISLLLQVETLKIGVIPKVRPRENRIVSERNPYPDVGNRVTRCSLSIEFMEKSLNGLEPPRLQVRHSCCRYQAVLVLEVY